LLWFVFGDRFLINRNPSFLVILKVIFNDESTLMLLLYKIYKKGSAYLDFIILEFQQAFIVLF